ncbi:uncharacterized protein NEMAJ01_0536 [Nematocida major]|uniref:uncharacterized protein n=1 Tax=Nematocida major TaxID=1912982 RepID=UPI002008A098|nr:uncharacterized protein NEMAJ01_0536 [Nematocida major]KAH9385640.1 hypothetical protein NEMAJ01_0536 [Nematocida major]
MALEIVCAVSMHIEYFACTNADSHTSQGTCPNADRTFESEIPPHPTNYGIEETQPWNPQLGKQEALHAPSANKSSEEQMEGLSIRTYSEMMGGKGAASYNSGESNKKTEPSVWFFLADLKIPVPENMEILRPIIKQKINRYLRRGALETTKNNPNYLQVLTNAMFLYVSRHRPLKKCKALAQRGYTLTKEQMSTETLGDRYEACMNMEKAWAYIKPYCKIGTGPSLSMYESIEQALFLILDQSGILIDFCKISMEFLLNAVKDADFKNAMPTQDNVRILLYIQEIALQIDILSFKKSANRGERYIKYIKRIRSACASSRFYAAYADRVMECYKKIGHIFGLYPKKVVDSDSVTSVYSYLCNILATFYTHAPHFYRTGTSLYMLLEKDILSRRVYNNYSVTLKQSTDPSKENALEIKSQSCYTTTNNDFYLELTCVPHYHVYYVDTATHACHRVCMPYYTHKGVQQGIHTVQDTVEHLAQKFGINPKVGGIYPYYTQNSGRTWSFVPLDKSQCLVKNPFCPFLYVFYYIENAMVESQRMYFINIMHAGSGMIDITEAVRIPIFIDALMWESLALCRSFGGIEYCPIYKLDFTERVPTCYLIQDFLSKCNRSIELHMYADFIMSLNEDISVGVECFVTDIKYLYYENGEIFGISWRERASKNTRDHAYYLHKGPPDSAEALEENNNWAEGAKRREGSTGVFVRAGHRPKRVYTLVRKNAALLENSNRLLEWSMEKSAIYIYMYGRRYSLGCWMKKIQNDRPAASEYLGIHFFIMQALIPCA